MDFDPAPTTFDTVLSPDWLGHSLGVAVESVEVIGTVVTVATKIRMRLGVRTDDGELEYQDVFLKAMLGEGTLTPRRADISATEARFYRDIAAEVGIRHPRLRYQGIHPDNGHGLLMMDDIQAVGAEFLNVLSVYTDDQARGSLDQLAKLHASHWRGAGLDRHPWLFSRFADMAANPWRSDSALAGLLADGRADGLTAETTSVDQVHSSLRALARRFETEPDTIVHGDSHAGNVYVLEGKSSLVDWQVVQRTHWSIDVAYHIAAVLPPDRRRDQERDLLAYYLDRLSAHGADAPAFDSALADYRRALVYGFYMWAVTMNVARPITVELTQRLGIAMEDWETATLLRD